MLIRKEIQRIREEIECEEKALNQKTELLQEAIELQSKTFFQIECLRDLAKKIEQKVPEADLSNIWLDFERIFFEEEEEPDEIFSHKKRKYRIIQGKKHFNVETTN